MQILRMKKMCKGKPKRGHEKKSSLSETTIDQANQIIVGNEKSWMN
jgi:hypothetical protein